MRAGTSSVFCFDHHVFLFAISAFTVTRSRLAFGDALQALGNIAGSFFRRPSIPGGGINLVTLTACLPRFEV